MRGLVIQGILRDKGRVMGKVRVGKRIRGSWKRKKGKRRKIETEREKNREREKEKEGGKKMSQIPMPFNREQNQTELIE